MKNLIVDNNQFLHFINLLPELKNDEVYFISLSARNKYLSHKERAYYNLGRTEMFGRTLIKKKEDFGNALKKLSTISKYKTTRNGRELPKKALVVYLNINPSSMIKAYLSFQNEMNRQLQENFLSLQNGNSTPNYSYFKIQERVLMNCIQKSISRKYFIDIDCDIQDKNALIMMKQQLNDYSLLYHVIKTQGGYHFLIRKDSIKKRKKVNLKNICDTIADEFKSEVMINKNAMVPLPGTLHATKLIEMI